MELLEKYPKAAKVVREYYLEKLITSLNAELPDDFKEHVRQQGITNEKIAKIIDNQARALFDVFDENEIYVQIPIVFDIHGKLQDFRFAVNKEINQGYIYKTRKEAEKAAVEEAFALLEEKL